MKSYFIEFKRHKGSKWTALKGLKFKTKEDAGRAWLELLEHGSYHAYRLKDKKDVPVTEKTEQRIKRGPKLKEKSITIIFKSIITARNEKEYAVKPKEYVKPLRLEDYQDYSNWKQLPRLITV